MGDSFEDLVLAYDNAKTLLDKTKARAALILCYEDVVTEYHMIWNKYEELKSKMESL